MAEMGLASWQEGPSETDKLINHSKAGDLVDVERDAVPSSVYSLLSRVGLPSDGACMAAATGGPQFVSHGL